MYTKILVPVDGSDTARRGLVEAIAFVKSKGGQIRLVHVVNELIFGYPYGGGAFAGDFTASLRAEGERVLDAAEALVGEAGLSCERTIVESIGGAAADLIVAQANAWPADLIVMGTHGRRGLRRLALGSDAEGVVCTAAVPVLLVRTSG